MDLGFILGKAGVPITLTQDISLLLVVAVFSLVFGIFIGRYKLITILINLYVSFAIVMVVPDRFFSEYTYKLVLFLALIILLTLMDRKFFEVYISGSGPGFLGAVFAMSFLETALLLSIIFSFMPKKNALGLVSPTALEYLISDNFRLIWMLAPLIVLIFINKKLER